MPLRDYIDYTSDAERIKDEIRCDPEASDAEIADRIPGGVSADDVAQVRTEMRN